MNTPNLIARDAAFYKENLKSLCGICLIPGECNCNEKYLGDAKLLTDETLAEISELPKWFEEVMVKHYQEENRIAGLENNDRTKCHSGYHFLSDDLTHCWCHKDRIVPLQLDNGNKESFVCEGYQKWRESLPASHLSLYQSMPNTFSEDAFESGYNWAEFYKPIKMPKISDEQIETLKRSMKLYGGSVLEIVHNEIPEDPDFYELWKMFNNDTTKLNVGLGIHYEKALIEFGYRHALKQLDN